MKLIILDISQLFQCLAEGKACANGGAGAEIRGDGRARRTLPAAAAKSLGIIRISE